MRSNFTGLLFLIIIGFFIIALAIVFFEKYKDFSKKLRSIERELKYAKGEEKKYWTRKKYKLWLTTWLPFFKNK